MAGPLALNRARLAERRGDLADAGPLFLAAAETYRALEDATGLYLSLSGAARAADAGGEGRAAADLHRRAADAAVFAGRPERGVEELRLSAAAHRRAGDAAEADRREAEAKRLAEEAAVGKRAAAAGR